MDNERTQLGALDLEFPPYPTNAEMKRAEYPACDPDPRVACDQSFISGDGFCLLCGKEQIEGETPATAQIDPLVIENAEMRFAMATT